MATARYDNHPILRCLAGVNGRSPFHIQGQIRWSSQFERAVCAIADEGARHCRRQYDAADGASHFNQRDVDGELAITLQEFLGPVERIDQEKTSPQMEWHAARRHFFLSDDGHPRRKLGESSEDECFGLLIGCCHGREIRFHPAWRAGRIMFQDKPSRFLRDFGQACGKLGYEWGHDCG